MSHIVSDLSDLGPGVLIYVGADASAQFASDRAIAARVIRIIDEWPTYWEGWVWLRVYELDTVGFPRARNVYVRIAGVVKLGDAPAPARTTAAAGPRPIEALDDSYDGGGLQRGLNERVALPVRRGGRTPVRAGRPLSLS